MMRPYELSLCIFIRFYSLAVISPVSLWDLTYDTALIVNRCAYRHVALHFFEISGWFGDDLDFIDYYGGWVGDSVNIKNDPHKLTATLLYKFSLSIENEFTLINNDFTLITRGY